MQLVAVQGDMMLDAPAARAWLNLEAAAASQYGVNLNLTAPAGAWRSEAMVIDMWLSSPARRKAVYGVPIGVGVARPKSLGGGGSVHQNGHCIDINNWSLIGSKKLNALARQFGFTQTISTEPWHLQHDGSGVAGVGGSSMPDQPKRRYSMTTNYVKVTTGDKAGGEGSLWATAGDAGTPCPGNWIEFTRSPADGSTGDRGSRMAAVHGNAIFLSDAAWDAHRAAYTTSVPGGSGGTATDMTETNRLLTELLDAINRLNPPG